MTLIADFETQKSLLIVPYLLLKAPCEQLPELEIDFLSSYILFHFTFPQATATLLQCHNYYTLYPFTIRIVLCTFYG